MCLIPQIKSMMQKTYCESQFISITIVSMIVAPDGGNEYSLCFLHLFEIKKSIPRVFFLL